MVLIITNNKVCTQFLYYFSFKFCKRLCISVLELFPTLVIKILSFQKNIYMKIAHTFFQVKVFLCLVEILQA